MALKDASTVAKRCVCLELLLQRLGLELDEDDTPAERDAIRIAWASRLGELDLDAVLQADERHFLETEVDGLTEDDVDDIEARVIGALILLWSLRRIGERPSAKMLGDATRLFAEYGVLGDGSIAGAKATIAKAALRPESELREALAAYATKRGDGSADANPEEMVATLAAQALEWVLG